MTHREAEVLSAATSALERTLPLLVRLGDFIGNGDGPGLGERCETILAVRKALALIYARGHDTILDALCVCGHANRFHWAGRGWACHTSGCGCSSFEAAPHKAAP